MDHVASWLICLVSFLLPNVRTIEYLFTVKTVSSCIPFVSKGSANGKFSAPCGIAVSPGGSIYISDRDNNRIQIISNYF